jgi:peroxiredoxin
MGGFRFGRAGLWLIVGLVLFGITAMPAGAISWGQRAPGFTLTDISGKPTALKDLLRRNQVVVLAIGTTWSYQFPSWTQKLQSLVSRYGDGQVAVATVFVRDKPKQVRLYANRYGLARDKLLLLVDSTGSLIRPYGLHEIPRLLLLDKAGTIHYDGTVEQIGDAVALLLKGEAVPAKRSKSTFTKPSSGY